jgi:putative hemolysin
VTETTLLVISIIIVASLTATATAVRSVSRIWLRHWVERRLSGAPAAALYLARPQRLILAATTAVALTVFAAGTFIGTAVPDRLASRAQAIVLYALALLLLGQLIPRAIARRWPSVIIPPLLPLLRGIEFVLMPLLMVVRRVTGEATQEREEAWEGDADTLGELLREGEMEGLGEHTEIAIIKGVVHFGEKRVRDVMTPASEVFAVEATAPADEIARRIAQSGYSRVPVYRTSLDHVEGMIHAFDILAASEAGLPTLRPVGIAAPTTACNDLLFRMLRDRRHLTVVRREDGTTAGIVTLEDLLEELVGDIRDEHDEPRSASPGPA